MSRVARQPLNLPKGVELKVAGNSVTVKGAKASLTLELKNLLPVNFVITPGMKIGQIYFEEMQDEARYPYGHAHNGSHYQGQRGPTLNRSHYNFKTIDVYTDR